MSRRLHSLLEPPILARFLEALRTGVPWSSACSYAGISRRTWQRVRLRGEADDGTAEQWADIVAQAERAYADGEMALFATVRKHAITDGRVALELLARSRPNAWGRVTQMTDMTRADDAELPEEPQHGASLEEILAYVARTAPHLLERHLAEAGHNREPLPETVGDAK